MLEFTHQMFGIWTGGINIKNLQKTEVIKKVLAEKSENTDISIYYTGWDRLLPRSNVWGPLVRDCCVIQCCTSGHGILTINENNFSIEKDQIFITFPGDIITETSDSNDPWGIIWIGTGGKTPIQYFNRIGISSKNPIFPWHANQTIIEHMQKIIKAGKISDSTNNLICLSEIFALFSELNRIYEDNNLKKKTNIQDEYINEAIKFMKMNYYNQIKITDVSAYIGLNRSYFYSLFKQHTGMSPQEFLIKIRMEKACEFFENPLTNITNVANSLGYEPRAFSRLFKRYIGVTPISYRKKCKKTTFK